MVYLDVDRRANILLKALMLLADFKKAPAAERAAGALKSYGDNLLRTAFFYLHNMHDAQDIVQDVMLQYIKTNPSCANEQHEKAWLLRVAINLCKNKLKRGSLHRIDELSESLAAEQREDLAFVWEAVKALPEAESETVHLYYQEGFSTREIAGLLGKNESTVRSLMFRAREKLKAILGEEYDFYD